MANNKKIRTKAQNVMIHALAAKIGLEKDDLHELAFDISEQRTDHTSELYVEEAAKLINWLQLKASPNAAKVPSRRTMQYRRQQAGIKQIVTPKHIDKMRRLWFTKPERTESGLESLTLRQIKREKPHTTHECNSVIEAIKAMNRREGIVEAFSKTKSQSEVHNPKSTKEAA